MVELLLLGMRLRRSDLFGRLWTFARTWEFEHMVIIGIVDANPAT